MEAILDFFLNWLVLPLIIIYGFVSWSKEHPDTNFMINPEDEEPKEKTTVKPDIKSE